MNIRAVVFFVLIAASFACLPGFAQASGLFAIDQTLKVGIGYDTQLYFNKTDDPEKFRDLSKLHVCTQTVTERLSALEHEPEFQKQIQKFLKDVSIKHPDVGMEIDFQIYFRAAEHPTVTHADVRFYAGTRPDGRKQYINRGIGKREILLFFGEDCSIPSGASIASTILSKIDRNEMTVAIDDYFNRKLSDNYEVENGVLYINKEKVRCAWAERYEPYCYVDSIIGTRDLVTVNHKAMFQTYDRNTGVLKWSRDLMDYSFRNEIMWKMGLPEEDPGKLYCIPDVWARDTINSNLYVAMVCSVLSIVKNSSLSPHVNFSRMHFLVTLDANAGTTAASVSTIDAKGPNTIISKEMLKSLLPNAKLLFADKMK